MCIPTPDGDCIQPPGGDDGDDGSGDDDGNDDGRLWAIRRTILPGALETAGGVGTLGLASYLGYRWLRSDATGD